MASSRFGFSAAGGATTKAWAVASGHQVPDEQLASGARCPKVQPQRAVCAFARPALAWRHRRAGRPALRLTVGLIIAV